MKNYFAIGLMLLTGCTSSTEFGPCVGLGQDKNPQIEYKLSGWNMGVGIIFFELVIPPIVVLTDELYCPIGRKQANKQEPL